MATIKKGILGPFSGKIGNVVGSSWKGLDVIRTIPKKKKYRFSKLQILQQANFILMTRFLRPLTDLLNITYGYSAVNMSGYNKAFSMNIHHIAGTYPSLKVNYSAIMLSYGRLVNGYEVTGSSVNKGKLLIDWSRKLVFNNQASETDQLYLAAYNEDKDFWYWDFAVAKRLDGTIELDLSHYSGLQMHVYLGFISENGKNCSNSLYLGSVKIVQ